MNANAHLLIRTGGSPTACLFSSMRQAEAQREKLDGAMKACARMRWQYSIVPVSVHLDGEDDDFGDNALAFAGIVKVHDCVDRSWPGRPVCTPVRLFREMESAASVLRFYDSSLFRLAYIVLTH